MNARTNSLAAPWETDVLAGLIDRKHAVLTQLREHTRLQESVVREGEMKALISLLASKQRLLGELRQVETALEPFRRQDPDARRWRSASARARCRDVSDGCSALLQEILLAEKRCATGLAQRRDGIAQQLQGMHAAADANLAYAAAPSTVLRTLDLTSDS